VERVTGGATGEVQRKTREEGKRRRGRVEPGVDIWETRREGWRVMRCGIIFC
jgi:hypothetical protein